MKIIVKHCKAREVALRACPRPAEAFCYRQLFYQGRHTLPLLLICSRD